MKNDFKRSISIYGSEFWDFYNKLSIPTQTKVDWVIDLLKTLKIVPDKYFKHIEGAKGLYEIRVKVGNNIFRIFCFFDKENLVILLNGFQKKTDKLPKNEIKKAEKLKAQYYEDKKK